MVKSIFRRARRWTSRWPCWRRLRLETFGERLKVDEAGCGEGAAGAQPRRLL